MDIDVVYILGSGSVSNDIEIYHSFRLLKKHLKNVRKFHIVGSYPKQKIDANYIACKDIYQHKNRNIQHKITHACAQDNISDTFLVFSDDVFLLKELDALNFPILHNGDLNQSIENNRISRGYRDVLSNTRQALSSRGFSTWNFNLHFGFPIVKVDFLEVIKQYDKEVGTGYAVKSLYANSVGIKGEYYPDQKVTSGITKPDFLKSIDNRLFFSIGETFFLRGGGQLMTLVN